MSTTLLLGAMLLVPQAGSSRSNEVLHFSNLSRQPNPWYIQEDGVVEEVCVCTDTDKAGRPTCVSPAFPAGLKKIGLDLRTDPEVKRGKLQVALWHNDVEERDASFKLGSNKHRTWWVKPKAAKTFEPGLYTFELVLDGELLAALDVVVISDEALPAKAVRQPEVTDVPPPPRLLAGAVGEPDGPVEVSLVEAPREPDHQPPSVAAPSTTVTPGTPETSSRGGLVDDMIASARGRSTDVPKKDGSGGKGGSVLGSALSASSPVSAAAKVVANLVGLTGKDGPTDFNVKRTQSSQKLAEKLCKSKDMEDVLYALGGRRPITHAVASVSDTSNFKRCVLIIPLTQREGDPTLMALLVIDDVSVAMNDAPVVADRGFEFHFKNDRVYALPILVDPRTATVEVLGAEGQTLVAGPAQLAQPEAQSQDPFAAIHQVIPQDQTGDRAVAICSLTPSLETEDGVAAVFPLLLSRERM